MAMVDKFERVCRLCSEERNEMLQIFGNEGIQRKVVHKLRACLPVMVYQTDPLPKQICQFCAARLDDVYEFRERCMNVYKKMYTMLLRYKQTESVKVFLNAMLNSSDPCQAQLCKKFRAPPPLVPLATSLLVDNSVARINQVNQDQNAFIETLPELPCEVEIKEMIVEPNSNAEISICKSLNKKQKWLETYRANVQTIANTFPMFDVEKGKEAFKAEHQMKKEEKRTSILEQVLTGNLTMNNLQRLQSKTKLTSEWLCAPCKTYYKTREALMKHMCLHCPRVYTCKWCHLSFQYVETLAKHEASNHLKVRLGSMEGLKDCDQCSRQFMSWGMLKQHRLRDHSTEQVENGVDTWCSVCNRSFLTTRSYQIHIQLHQTTDKSMQSQKSFPIESALPALKTERSREVKRTEQFNENTKSLSCPTCGKVCTQQSALSNHMRTHEPKRFKCNFCGRSFGLYIRLAAHKMSEHIKQSAISPIMSAVEQEEALNAEREAREAREARTRVIRRSCPELHKTEKNYVPLEDEPGGFKKIAKCGICSRWFSDHTTLLTHLQTHSDNCRSYVCHVCKMSFKEQRQLTRHEACHKLTSLYMCNTCNKSFTDKSLYKAHQKTHTVDKTYHCAKCNKIFFKEVSLLAHQCTGGSFLGKRIFTESMQKTSGHDNSKRYKYDSSFSTSPSRNTHTKAQNDNTYGNAVQRHEIKVETDEDSMPKLSPEMSLEYNAVVMEPKVEIDEHNVNRPLKRTLIRTSNGYRCGVCESPFVLRELAVAHLRSAHPVMSYQCCYSYCKKRFTTQYTFSHHMKTEHPDEPEK